MTLNDKPYNRNMEQAMEEVQCDRYGDSIMLMDEAQLAANREWLVAGMNNLMQHEWASLILPTAGRLDIEVAGVRYTCRRGQLLDVVMSEGIVLCHFSDDFSAKTICMSHDFTRELDLDDTLGSSLAVRRHPLCSIDEQTFHAVELIFEQLRAIIALDDNPYRHIALQLIVSTYYYTIGYYLRREADTVRRTADEALSDQFLKLVERDFREHRDIDHYADALNVSKQYLSACVSRTTGSTATQHIARNVAIWAKKRLTYSNLSVEQISEELHFANPSHFGTYFKRMAGLSPAAYRKAKR